MVEACMNWAKAECLRKNLDENVTNIRAQMGDLYQQVPFDKLELEEFSAFIASHQGFFTAEEFEKIIQSIALDKATASEQQHVNEATPHDWICDRTSDIRDVSRKSNTLFSVNRTECVFLVGFSVDYKQLFHSNVIHNLTYSVSYRRSDTKSKKNIIPKTTLALEMTTAGTLEVELPKPIYIMEVGIYEIELTFNRHMSLLKYPALSVPLSNGVMVNFILDQHNQENIIDAISALEFISIERMTDIVANYILN